MEGEPREEEQRLEQPVQPLPLEKPEKGKAKNMISIVCSYCKKEYGQVEDTVEGRSGAVSHGVCPVCYKKELAKLEE